MPSHDPNRDATMASAPDPMRGYALSYPHPIAAGGPNLASREASVLSWQKKEAAKGGPNELRRRGGSPRRWSGERGDGHATEP